MYLSKKIKILIACGVPAAVLATATAIAWPVVAIQDKQINQVLNDQGFNYVPELVSKDKINKLLEKEIIRFNPEGFSVEFFVKNIANQPLDPLFLDGIDLSDITDLPIEKIKSTNDLLFNFPSNQTGVQYEIKRVWPEAISESKKQLSTKEDNSFTFLKAEVVKKYQDRTVVYDKEIDQSNISFIESSDDEKEHRNFLKYAVKEFKDLIKENYLQVRAHDADSTDVSTYKDKLELITHNGDIDLFKTADNSYTINLASENAPNGIFRIDDKEQVEFSFAGTSGVEIWDSSQAWPINDKGEFDKDKSAAYKFLDENKKDLFLEGATGTEEQKLKNYIFDPDNDPYVFNEKNQKIPRADYAAVLVKLEIGGFSTYTIIWQNLVQSAFEKIIENAPELEFKIVSSTPPTKDEFEKNPKRYLRVSSESEVKQGLKYDIDPASVKVTEEGDDYKVAVDVVISLVDAPKDNPKYKKTYKLQDITGLKTKSLTEFDKKVDALVNGGTDLSKITPTAKLADEYKGKSLDEVLLDLEANLTNPDTFKTKVELTPPTKDASFIEYIPEIVNSADGKVLITYKVTEKNKPENQSTNYPTVMVLVDLKPSKP